MDARNPDERFLVDGAREDDGPGGGQPRKFTVRIGEQQRSAEYGGGRDPDSSPLYRLTEWTGPARDKDQAVELAEAAFEAEHNAPPKGPYSVHVTPLE